MNLRTLYSKATHLTLVAAFLFLGTMVAGCDAGFSSINENPNEPESVEPSLLLPSITRTMVTRSVFDAFLKGNVLAQHSSKSLRQRYEIYDPSVSSSETWDDFYDALRDVDNLIALAEERGDDASKGAGLVLKAWGFSVLTDTYGDIPYSEAIGAKDGAYFPAFDTQSSIYLGADGEVAVRDGDNGLLGLLDQANTLLAGGGVLAGDILLGESSGGGFASRWQKFANSLRLRLLMRISGVVDVSAEMQAIVSDPVTYPVMENSDESAVLDFLGSGPNAWPLLPLKTGDFDAVFAGETLVNQLTNLNDPRLAAYARPTTPGATPEVYIGRENGRNTVSQSEFSRLGYRYYNYPGHPTANEIANGIIMTHAELQFILAEAAERGLITGDAEGYYNAGVASSMTYYDVALPFGPISSLADYLAQDDVSLSAATSSADRLERIATQKWIALYFHGLEPWFDFRRTGAAFSTTRPSFIQPGADVVGGMLMRFKYPGSAQSLNFQNYQTAISRLDGGSDNVYSRMWWDVD